MSNWYEQNTWNDRNWFGTFKNVAFVLSIAAMTYMGISQYVFQRPERKALYLDDDVMGKNLSYVDDEETKQAVFRNTGKLFVVPGAHGNRVYTFVPVDEYMPDDMKAYIQAYIMLKSQEATEEALRKVEAIKAEQAMRNRYSAETPGYGTRVVCVGNDCGNNCTSGNECGCDPSCTPRYRTPPQPVAVIRDGKLIKLAKDIQLEMVY